MCRGCALDVHRVGVGFALDLHSLSKDLHRMCIGFALDLHWMRIGFALSDLQRICIGCALDLLSLSWDVHCRAARVTYIRLQVFPIAITHTSNIPNLTYIC